MTKSIPIFPLNLVVFPYSRIPLHIFEEKYKKMIIMCLKEKSGFGIVSILKKELSKIGSYVEITDVLNKYANGEMDIVVKGTGRFKIIETKHSEDYLTARVEEYADIPQKLDVNLLKELRNNFLSIIKKINFKLDDTFWQNYEFSELKSYKIAEKSGLSLEQQQKLLSLQQENERIDFLIEHLEKLDKQVNENIMTGAIILGNGYLS